MQETERECINPERHPEYFGPLWDYVRDEQVTDIDLHAGQLWITRCDGARRLIPDHGITEGFLEQFSQRIANLANRPFNRMHNVLEVSMEYLRVSLIHEASAVSGRSLSIRKSLPGLRFSVQEAIRADYCSEEMMDLLANCVRAGLNLIFCGEPGAGKTECAKFFSGFIPEDERVITIEETREWHYRSLYPKRDCVELQVDERLAYPAAIRASLRQNPSRILVSEVRGLEIVELLSCWSSGIPGITTLHTNDARKVPDRMCNMAGRAGDALSMLADIYMFLDAAVFLEHVWDPVKNCRVRRIAQICFFTRQEGQNVQHLVIDEQCRTGEKLPEEICRHMKKKGILDPWKYQKD